jgi:hypothetical protein
MTGRSLELLDVRQAVVHAFVQVWADTEHYRGKYRDHINTSRACAANVACEVDGVLDPGELLSTLASFPPAPYLIEARDRWVEFTTRQVLAVL